MAQGVVGIGKGVIHQRAIEATITARKGIEGKVGISTEKQTSKDAVEKFKDGRRGC
jgi:hypothetical protein